MQHRERCKKHCKEHLHILALLEKERNEEASEVLCDHLQHMLDVLSRIGDVLSNPRFGLHQPSIAQD